MDVHAMPLGDKAPNVMNAFIEIPSGTHNKYEYDEELGAMKLDRVLFSPFFYPVDYGFLPQTLADDGDPLDVLVVTSSPVFPGCVEEIRPVGILKMEDDKGGDDKVLAVPAADPRFDHITELEHVSPHVLKEIVHFFETYKQLEKKEVKVTGWYGRDEALSVVEAARQAYQK